ncbi:hypothetical protein GGF31_007214 [Allomyces arbusculus]|nr:hypothetical protein GGF31_007214 [Allomyces arbusculus]
MDGWHAGALGKGYTGLTACTQSFVNRDWYPINVDLPFSVAEDIKKVLTNMVDDYGIGRKLLAQQPRADALVTTAAASTAWDHDASTAPLHDGSIKARQVGRVEDNLDFASAHGEFDRYCNDDERFSVPFSHESMVEWWHKIERRSPMLYKVAQDFACLCGTIVDAEQ